MKIFSPVSWNLTVNRARPNEQKLLHHRLRSQPETKTGMKLIVCILPQSLITFYFIDFDFLANLEISDDKLNLPNVLTPSLRAVERVSYFNIFTIYHFFVSFSRGFRIPKC